MDTATATFEQALRLQPNLVAAHIGLANVLQDSQRFELALLHYDRAIELDPQNAEARFTRALFLLRQGDFENGWREYEWRWKTVTLQSRSLPGEHWKGEPLHGRSILVHAEQGLGDTIQFVRYLKAVKASGGRVIFAGPERLAHILKLVDGIDEFVVLGKPMPEFDVDAPLLSLPFIFRTEFDCIPGTEPYIYANSDQVAAWAVRLADAVGLKVGICWQSNPNHRRDAKRSIPIKAVKA